MFVISVIIPVYNAVESLQRCVESVVNQMRNEIEILLIDDGSVDGSAKLCDELSNEYESVKVYHKENAGVSSARNLGLDKANGKYAIFLDADDQLEKNALKALYDNIRRYNADFCIGGMAQETVYRSEKAVNLFFQYERQCRFIAEEKFADEIHILWDENNMLSACGKMFDLEKINGNSIRFDEKLVVMEDTDFVVKYMKQIRSVVTISEIVYRVCSFSGRQSWLHRSRMDYVDDVSIVHNRVKQFFAEIGCDMRQSSQRIFIQQYALAIESLWQLPTKGRQDQVRKIKRLKSAYRYSVICDIITQNKSKHTKIERWLLENRFVIGLWLMRKYVGKISVI